MWGRWGTMIVSLDSMTSVSLEIRGEVGLYTRL